MDRVFFCFFKCPRGLFDFAFIGLSVFFCFLSLVFLLKISIFLFVLFFLRWILTLKTFRCWFARTALAVNNFLKIGTYIVLLPIFVLGVFIEARCFNLLMINLRAIVKTRIGNTMLMTHIIRLHFIWVLLTASHAMGTPIAKSTSVLWFCIRSELTLNLTKHLKIFW